MGFEEFRVYGIWGEYSFNGGFRGTSQLLAGFLGFWSFFRLYSLVYAYW